jgi:hypothetical protein
VALNPVNPIESASATATNGSPTISVTGGVDCSFIVPGFVLQLGTRRIVTAISGTAPVSGTSTITLAANWDQPTTTDKLIGWNSYESLPNIVNRIQNALGNQTAIGELTTNGLVERTGANAFSTVAITAFGKTLLDDADAAAARTTLGAQASDATLTALAGVTTASNKIIYFTGVDVAAAADLSAYGRTLIAAADAAAARTALSAQAADATLTALAGVTTAANKIIYFTGVDAAAAADLSAFGRSVIAGADAAAVNALLGVQSKATTDLVAQLFQRATLDLNFATNRHNVYGAFGPELTALTAAITTARNSTATYQSPTVIGSAAVNTPRITYDAATGNALGLLAEEQRTNLLLHSQYTGASGETLPTGWSSTETTGVTTTQASPRFAGAIRITATGTAQRENIFQTVTLVAATTYTLSAYFAAGTVATDTVMRVTTSDTPTGTLTLAGSVIVAAGVYSITFTTVSGGAYAFRVGLGCTGNATGTVIHETPQLEVGPAPTSYIPTTTAQVTRAADVISRALTTTNVNAGSIFIEFDLTSYSKVGNTTIVSLNAATQSSERGFALTVDSNSIQAWIRSASSVSDTNITVADSLQQMKAIVSFDNVDLKILVSVNGAVSERSIASAIDISSFVSNLYISGGLRISGAPGVHSKTVKRCTYFPRSMTAAEAQAITA